MIQGLHHAFVGVKTNMRESQLKNQEFRGPDVGFPYFEVGDKVFYANLKNEPGLNGKLKRHCRLCFHILERVSPVNYLITHLPTGNVLQVHASHVRLIPCDLDWNRQFSEPVHIISTGEQSRL